MEEKKNDNLLSTLHTEFKIFKQEQFTQFSHDLNTRLDRFFVILETKADKDDVKENRKRIDNNVVEIATLKTVHRDSKIKKDAVISFGKMGLNIWQALAAFIAAGVVISGAVTTIINLK